jgi:hypothetical protein
MAGIVGSDGRAGVYWLGQNGSVYTKNNLGQTVNAGPHAGGVASVLAPGADASIGGYTYRNIADPFAPAPATGAPAPSAPNGTSGGGGGSSYTDKSNDISLQNAGLSAVGDQTTAGLSAVDRALANIMGQYDTESKSNEGTYQTQSDTNQNNLQKSKQSALVNGSQGRQGLFGKLASIGALSGDGIKLANNAVQQGVNEDLSGAADTYGTNQSGLDTAIGTFRQEDKMRRENANNSATDARTGVNNQAAKSRQTFYSNLANDYAAQGDMANARKFTALAAAEYPNVANTSVPSTNLAYTGAAFTPTTLSNYITGANSTQVSTSASPDNYGIPTLVAGNTKRKTA